MCITEAVRFAGFELYFRENLYAAYSMQIISSRARARNNRGSAQRA